MNTELDHSAKNNKTILIKKKPDENVQNLIKEATTKNKTSTKNELIKEQPNEEPRNFVKEAIEENKIAEGHNDTKWLSYEELQKNIWEQVEESTAKDKTLTKNELSEDSHKDIWGLVEETVAEDKTPEDQDAYNETSTISEKEMEGIILLVERFRHCLVVLQVADQHEISREEAKVITNRMDPAEFKKLADNPSMPALQSAPAMSAKEYGTLII
jgi:hypothetical protein